MDANICCFVDLQMQDHFATSSVYWSTVFEGDRPNIEVLLQVFLFSKQQEQNFGKNIVTLQKTSMSTKIVFFSPNWET